jgi:anti-sigma-K factor RskA
MTDELRDLSALDALGALTPEESRRLADAADADARLAAQRDADRAVVAALEATVARVSPPADLGDRIIALTRAEAASAPAPAAPRRWRDALRRRPLIPALAGAVAVAAAAVAITLVVTRDPGLGTPATEAAVVAHDPGSGVGGTAALYDPSRPDGKVVVDLTELPPAPSGHHYEVWVLRTGAAEMEAVGSFSPDRPSVHLELPLPGAGAYGALDVSVEEDGGPAGHSGKSVAGATFGAT